MTARPTGADRWAALGFGPPAGGLAEPDRRCSSTTSTTGGSRSSRSTARRRQRHHDRDGSAADRDPRERSPFESRSGWRS